MFLDFVLNELADAGFDALCLVIGPEHDALREYYAGPFERVRVDFAVQAEPRGTADAVLALDDWAGDDRFLVVNSDNLYPAPALAALRHVPGSGVVGWDALAMVEQSNISADRIAGYAILEVGADGRMIDVLEKPDAATLAAHGPHALVSMNCWLFEPSIFAAARSIRPSHRNEYEITDAVRAAVAAGTEFDVVSQALGVLDLANRADIATAERALAGKDVRL